MATSFALLPGDLNLSLVTGDEFGMLVDLDFDVTNYTWTAVVYESTTTSTFGNPSGVVTQGSTAATFTVTVVNAGTGMINLSLTETQTNAFNPSTTYRWYLRGVSPAQVTRTYLAGTFTVKAP